MRYVRVIDGRVDGWPREDARPSERLRKLGLVPVEEGNTELPLSCASCFEAIFYGFDYDRDTDKVHRGLLTLPEARTRLIEWLFRSLSVRESTQAVTLHGCNWAIPMTQMVWFDLFSGAQTKTPTLVYGYTTEQRDLLEINHIQAAELIKSARLDYLRAARTVQQLRNEAFKAGSLDDLVELTATLDARLPWVSFTRRS